MSNVNRRDFLADVGRGMLAASVGTALAQDLGLNPLRAEEAPNRLDFGELEPLVAMMQETPTDRLLPRVMEKLAAGTDLKTMVAAGALANARTFGGQDYTGYHTFMALPPAWEMAQELPRDQQALPVLKVLYRNTDRIHAVGGVKKEVLRPVAPAKLSSSQLTGEALQAATRRVDWKGAEQTFAAIANEPIGEAYNHLQYTVQDATNVHRIVLCWRAWESLDLVGKEHAHTLLRQSVRFCLDRESNRVQRNQPEPEIRALLPKLIDQYRLLSKSLGRKQADDAWVESMARTIFAASRDQAADAVAQAIAEGFAPASIAEAMSLAANMLLLHDPGRRDDRGYKDKGSVHGDSVGVHASDAANAWWNIAAVSNQRNTVASLIVGAYHTAGQSNRVGKESWPTDEDLERVAQSNPRKLLAEADAAIQDRDQRRVCALVHRYGELDGPAQPMFRMLLGYAISEDGALHAEKYYQTVREEFARMRPAFKWRELTALARVTASEYGRKAPGIEQAQQLVRVST